MPKTKLSDILKNPESFKLPVIDYSSPKMQKQLKKTMEMSERIRKGSRPTLESILRAQMPIGI